jgi:hypothetical protein
MKLGRSTLSAAPPVDARLKEYTTGSPHDITDRLFAVRRAFRLKDHLPPGIHLIPRWRWQTGG